MLLAFFFDDPGRRKRLKKNKTSSALRALVAKVKELAPALPKPVPVGA
jgi:hypothetical protein